MTKKLLALSVSVLMLMSIFCAFPVSAVELPENIGTDYVPGAYENNLFNGFQFNNMLNFSVVAVIGNGYFTFSY